ncbi:pyridoxine 5'-phosphate synthase [Synechococcus sp. PCC 7336]|uniref:pyridoxine 5'-phosphate synthase n=1 Tax=Synechococcus sp. PCC 7336 TaxID=195250 RepID=UPI0003476BFB|nr:pyridoxine 5'-phosphate synthase [Synechococcus sp. PCC 7336]
MATQLSVNLNKVALLRNSRNLGIPSVLKAARMALEAGAYGVTVHPRPDERHIRYADVDELDVLLEAEYPTVEFNIEGNPFLGRFMEVVTRVRPTQATLVPDDPNAFTSDRGWDIAKDGDRLRPILKQLQDLGIRVSLFMDPDVEQIRLAGELGPERIELYTEPYATAFRDGKVDESWPVYAEAAKLARAVGLGVNAGHDLNLNNLAKFCEIPGILEVSIGHALTADALEMGMPEAVRHYLAILAKD